MENFKAIVILGFKIIDEFHLCPGKKVWKSLDGIAKFAFCTSFFQSRFISFEQLFKCNFMITIVVVYSS